MIWPIGCCLTKKARGSTLLQGRHQHDGAPEPEATFYTVQSGDSLSKIAKEYYGDAMKYPEIFEANREVIKDPDLIYPGQKIRIPKLS